MKKLLVLLVIALSLVSCSKDLDTQPLSPASLQFRYNGQAMVKYGTPYVTGNQNGEWYTIMGTRNDTTLTFSFRAENLQGGTTLTLNSSNSVITYRAGMETSMNEGAVVTLQIYTVNRDNTISGAFSGKLYSTKQAKLLPLTEGEFINLVFR